MVDFVRDDIDFSLYLDQTDHDHKVVSSATFADQVTAYFWDETLPRGERLPWEKATGKLAFRSGEVSLWAGYNGHGKSLALGQFCISLVTQRATCAIASLEMKPMITLARMCRQAAGTNRPDPGFIADFHRLTDARIWMYDQQGMVDADKMIGVMNYCATVKKTKHFVLDSFLKCGIAEDDYTRQKHFIDRICTVARDTGMHIHVVAHSKKAKDEATPPGKMDVKGSGAITDQVDNVLSWWRNKPKEDARRSGKDVNDADPDAVLTIDKQRNGDWEGKLGFWFEPGSLQFVESMRCLPMDMLVPPA